MDQEFLQYLKDMESRMTGQFDALATSVKEGFDEASEERNEMKHDIKELKQEVKIIKSTAVTKEYLDDKLSDLGAEIGKRINASHERQKEFNKKLIFILRNSNSSVSFFKRQFVLAHCT